MEDEDGFNQRWWREVVAVLSLPWLADARASVTWSMVTREQ